jgi:hypothetical protein
MLNSGPSGYRRPNVGVESAVRQFPVLKSRIRGRQGMRRTGPITGKTVNEVPLS